MVFYLLIGLGGFLLILGMTILIIDAFRTHWRWGAGITLPALLALAAYELPMVPQHFQIFIGCAAVTFLISLIFMGKHWGKARRGGILEMLGIPLLAASFFLQPPVDAKAAAAGKTGINDPFAEAMNRTRAAIAQIKESRKEDQQPKAPAAAAAVTEVKTAAPAPVPTTGLAKTPPAAPLTLPQRWSANRQKFKDLATQFEALKTKRSQLPKNDLVSIHAFNAEAADYASNLDAARAEQAKLQNLPKNR